MSAAEERENDGLRARVASLESDLVGSATKVGELLDANRRLSTELAGAHMAVDAMRPGYEAAPELRTRVAELERREQLVERERVELLTALERALAPFCEDLGAAAAAAAAVRHYEAEWLLRDARRLQDRVAELEGLYRDSASYAAQLEGRLRDMERTPFSLDAEVSADKLTRLLAPTQALREDEAATKCRCSEPHVDPYSCEAEDCTHEFSELSPFGGSGPVEGHDAKVSRTCGCGWRTSVWHVDDGSAEAELHGHVTRVHGGVYPAGGGS